MCIVYATIYSVFFVITKLLLLYYILSSFHCNVKPRFEVIKNYESSLFVNLLLSYALHHAKRGNN